MLRVSNITKTFGSIKALNNCSLTINRNKVTAIVGPNGAGKTTLFNIISGFIKQNSGSILLDNTNLRGLRPHSIAQLGVARSWQQVRLFDSLLVWHHLAMAENNNDIKIMQNLIKSEKVPWKRYKEYLNDFDLGDFLNSPVSSLSFGQGKLLQLTMVLIKNHKLILLDEPVAGVSYMVQQRIENKLLELKKKKETLVVIEHNIEFVKKIADKVIVLDQGKVLAEGTPTKVFGDQRVIEAYLGA